MRFVFVWLLVFLYVPTKLFTRLASCWIVSPLWSSIEYVLSSTGIRKYVVTSRIKGLNAVITNWNDQYDKKVKRLHNCFHKIANWLSDFFLVAELFVIFLYLFFEIIYVILLRYLDGFCFTHSIPYSINAPFVLQNIYIFTNAIDIFNSWSFKKNHIPLNEGWVFEWTYIFMIVYQWTFTDVEEWTES